VIHKRTRKEYRRFIARWRRGECDEEWLTRGEKVPASPDEQRHWLRSILGHYGGRAAESGARLFRIRLFGLAEAMPCTPLGEKDPEGWRAESHRDLQRHHCIVLGISLACRRLLRDLPPPQPKPLGDLFDMLDQPAEVKAGRRKKTA
jgi:hypothetical protein